MRYEVTVQKRVIMSGVNLLLDESEVLNIAEVRITVSTEVLGPLNTKSVMLMPPNKLVLTVTESKTVEAETPEAAVDVAYPGMPLEITDYDREYMQSVRQMLSAYSINGIKLI